MAKKVYKIEVYHGGINKRNDPRDIKPEELEEAFNVDVSNPGRITTTGDGKSYYETTNELGVSVGPTVTNQNDHILQNNVGNTPSLTSGYGLFTFSHDYNMMGLNDGESSNTPAARHTDFLCINDGAHIDIFDTCHDTHGNAAWINSAISLGEVHYTGNESNISFFEKVAPIYYKAGNGLRVCDGHFSESESSIANYTVTAEATSFSPVVGGSAHGLGAVGVTQYIKIDDEILKVTTTNQYEFTALRGQFGTTATAHTAASFIQINVPKVLSHIKRPMLQMTGTGVAIDAWKEDVQCLEPPNDYGTKGFVVYDGKVTGMATTGTTSNDTNSFQELTQEPDAPEKVLFSVHESNSEEDNIIKCNATTAASSLVNGQSAINLIAEDTSTNWAASGYTVGKFVIVSGSTNYDGLHEILKQGANAYTMQISGEHTDPEDTLFEVRLEENRISEDLQNKYIFGCSFMYPGGGGEMQESPIKMGHLYSGIIQHDSATGKSADNWYSDTTAAASTALPASNTDSWEHSNGGYHFDESDINDDGSSDKQFLIYKSATADITAGNTYKIAIDVTISTGGELTIYPPGHDAAGTSGGTVGSEDDSGDGTMDDATITLNESGVYLLNAKAPSDGTYTQIFVCYGKHDGGNITINNVQVFSATPTEMSASNAIDMRGWEGIPKMFSSFNMNTYADYTWNERISGYKVYMKQVDSASQTLSSEWLLALKVDFKTGQYTNYANDNVEQTLSLSDSWSKTGYLFPDSLVTTVKDSSNTTGKSDMDTMRNIPLDTYQSENGYEAEVNTAARYKTAAIVDRKVFIGNIKIGDTTYPDRMIEAPADRFDTFPDDSMHFIDVATADGDEIVHLESIGDKLIQFKKKHVYLIGVSSEGVEPLDTWMHAGVRRPSQIIKAGGGIVWVNNNGLYYYDGKELQQVTKERFNSDTWNISESDTVTTIVGFDETSNKVIVLTSNVSTQDNGGYIFDLATGSIVQSQNVFNWAIKEILDADGALSSSNIYRTNMVTTTDKKLVLATNSELVPNHVQFTQWDDSPKSLFKHSKSAESFNIQTKDIDFDNPSRRKKIYKVYVTFKAGGYVSGVRLRYATNGSNSFTGKFRDTTYYSDAKGFDSYNGAQNSSTADWITVALKPTTDLTANNIYSMQLKFDYADAGLNRRFGANSNAGTNTINLGSTASTTDDYYNGMPLYVYSGPGFGQDLRVKDYDGSTRVATIDNAEDGDLSDTATDTLATIVRTNSHFDVGFIPKQFQINDISIIYREKRIK